MLRTAALEVPKGALVQPFFRVRVVNDVFNLANLAPSSEVKHWALEKVPPSASTLTTPLGAMSRRPLVALHRSTGTKTLVAGRNAAGSVNGTGLVPPVAMAPLRCMTPPMLRTAALEVPKGALVQPFLSVSGVNEVAVLAND